MTRVLVTGATGFVGRHVLAPLCELGFDVHAVARTRGPDESVVWHEADLLDERASAKAVREIGASHLLHLAWYAEHGKFWHAEENLDWVTASVHLVRSFHAAGGRRAVFAGTCAEYDWSGDCCGDGTPLRPATLYGASKNALRELVEAYGRTTGLSMAWGRIFFTFGPGEHPTRVVASVARALAAGDEAQCTAGTQVRDFLYVEDVAWAFAELLASDAEGTFDVGSGEPVALRDLLARLEQLAGARDLVHFGAPADEPARIVADPRRLRDEVGWRPRHELDDALARTLAAWRSG